jgi:LIVCS family branched-chain amino acid:cation transporter
MAIYPIAISLIFLTFLHPVFKGRSEVYQGSLILTFIISLFDGLNAAGIKINVINDFFTHLLPLYNVGLGWLIPSVLGGVAGYIFTKLRGRKIILVLMKPKKNK